MGNTLLYKAVNRGRPVTYVPPKNAYKFTEEMLKFRKHADLIGEDGQKIADTVFDNVDAATVSLVADSYCFDYGYWWIELCGEKADIIEEYEELRDELLKCVCGVWDHIKNGGNHGAQNYDLEWVGMLPGMRESRRLEGEYMLTENDLRSNRIFPDAVAYAGSSKATTVHDSGKTKNVLRTIPLPKLAVRILQGATCKEGYVLGGETPMCYSTHKRTYEKAFEHLGIKGRFSSYDFRTTYGTELCEAGLTSKQVGDLMGHADTRMVETVYARSRQEGVMQQLPMLNKLNQAYENCTDIDTKTALKPLA